MKIPAGKPPKLGKVAIVKVERLDEDGNPLEPPEFWVVQLGTCPKVLSTHSSYEEARNWVVDNNYDLEDSPAP